jgi:hypothetical protein
VIRRGIRVNSSPPVNNQDNPGPSSLVRARRNLQVAAKPVGKERNLVAASRNLVNNRNLALNLAARPNRPPTIAIPRVARDRQASHLKVQIRSSSQARRTRRSSRQVEKDPIKSPVNLGRGAISSNKTDRRKMSPGDNSLAETRRRKAVSQDKTNNRPRAVVNNRTLKVVVRPANRAAGVHKDLRIPVSQHPEAEASPERDRRPHRVLKVPETARTRAWWLRMQTWLPRRRRPTSS